MGMTYCYIITWELSTTLACTDLSSCILKIPMAAAIVAGATLSAFLQVLFDRMASREVVDFLWSRMLGTGRLLQELKASLLPAKAVLDDEEMQMTNEPRDLDGSTVRLPSLVDRFDSYGGVSVEIQEDMDADVFAPLLGASISNWKEQGKKAVWIKLPIEYSHLADNILKEGFRYHHAEPTYLMLVRWLPEETLDAIPMNASHRVRVGAFVLNDKREVLVVQEHSGRFQGTGVWKLPTGVVNEGEDICDAVVREVKEETGVDTKFVEILCFRQSHKSFFTKSDLFFLCVLQPESSAIDKQNVEIEAAQWMPIEEYAAQPFVVGNKQFNFMAKICLAKADHGYPGFSARATTTRGGKRNYIYCNNPEIVENFASLM